MKKKLLLVGVAGIMALSLTGCKKETYVQCTKNINNDGVNYELLYQGKIENKKIVSGYITLMPKEDYGKAKDFTKYNEIVEKLREAYGDKVPSNVPGAAFYIKDIDKLPNGEKITDITVKDFKKIATAYDSELNCSTIKE